MCYTIQCTIIGLSKPQTKQSNKIMPNEKGHENVMEGKWFYYWT